MGRKGQHSGIASRISYLLVLLASLMAFGVEPGNAADRLSSSISISVDCDEDQGSGPDDNDFTLVEATETRSLGTCRYINSHVVNDRAVPTQSSYHFLVRGPPSQLG